jgi:hypothetical protein
VDKRLSFSFYVSIAFVLCILFTFLLFFSARQDWSPYNLVMPHSDTGDYWNLGNNLVNGRGYVLTHSQHNCFTPPCDARNRFPLYALLLSGFNSAASGGFFIAVSCFVLSCILIYIEGGGLAVFFYLCFFKVYEDLFNFGLENVYFLLFICCMVSLKEKWFKTFTIGLVLLLLARFPLGVALLAASFILVKESRKYAIFPVLVLAFYVVFMSGNNPLYNQLYTGLNEPLTQKLAQEALNPGADLTYEPSLLDKIYNILITFLVFLFKSPLNLLWFLAPAVLYACIKQKQIIFLLTFFFLCIVHSPFFYDFRYSYMLFYGLVYVANELKFSRPS